MRVVIENVSKEYYGRNGSSVKALFDINITLNQGEFLVLVGPSGCGKSTLLNMIGGLLSPSTGRIYFEGLKEDRDIAVGMVFQEIGLFPWRTVYENIAFGLEEMSLDKPEEKKRVAYYQRMVGLEGLDQFLPMQLSGGMRQRVAIARALAIQPGLLLLDEPLSALDAQTRTLMQEEMLKIWDKTHLSTVYVTHNIQEAVYLADRIIVLSRRPGTIVATIPITLPKFGRDNDQYMKEYNGYVEKIWRLIRKDAEDALRGGNCGDIISPGN